MTEIDARLAARFQASAGDPGHVEAVIVTLAPGADAGVLDAAGMEVAHRMRSRPIVTGHMTAATFWAVTRSEAVLRVEPDGQMQALE